MFVLLIPLYLFLMVPVPIAVGFLVALVLRELYIRQGGTFETKKTREEPEIRPEEIAAEKENPTAENTDSSEEQPTEVQTENPEPLEVPTMTTEEILPGTTADAPESEEKNEPALAAEPQSVFDNPIPVPVDLRIDNALEEMLDDVNPIVPSDISSRLNEESAAVAENTYDEDEDTRWFRQEEDDIMQRLNAAVDEPGITLSDAQIGGQEFSPMAVELLGEDFDFNALENPSSFSSEDIAKQDTQDVADVSISSVSPNDVYQTDTVAAFSESSTEELKPERHEIAPIFPADLISGAVIEPETAEQFCFVEELRPMFVPKHKTRKA